jgi:hypothetical protein
MLMNNRISFLLFAIASLYTTPARAWDAGGHMLIDEIAWTQMKPAARSTASDLVRTLDPTFNDRRPYNFVTSGAWMDDMRGLGKDYHWGRLHYIDIPWTPSGVEIKLPTAPHVLSGIDDCLSSLRDPATSPARRTEALGMLIHFVGDLHQPLHVTERNYDRGGNSYLIAGVPFSDLIQRQASNLHTFWDKAYRFDGVADRIVETWIPPGVASRPDAPGQGIIAEEAKKIMAEFPRKKLPELATPGDATTWAEQTHTVGCLHAYPPGDPPPNTEVRALEPAFAHEAHAIANRQLALAGYRLADLLNSLFAP